jgi:8-oxo-dGTP diphosphatase
MKKYLHVAVGVIENNLGQILIAKRPESAHQGGLWEFPGGKVDSGENCQQALFRELNEELAIQVENSEPLIQIRHDYNDKSVLLDVHKVTCFSGEPKGNEGQPVRWVNPEFLSEYAFPAANQPIIQAVRLSRFCAITGSFDSLNDFTEKFSRLVSSKRKMVQLRIKDFSLQQHNEYIDVAKGMCDKNIQLQVNTSVNEFLKIDSNFKLGLHLNSRGLMQLEFRPVDKKILLGASCHSLAELKRAEKIQADYVYLSPVKPTYSHPGVEALGWEKFQKIVEQINIPVYALGGMTETDLTAAIQSGAQGIASISAWWCE